MTRTWLALALAVIFLVLAAVVPTSSGYLATVGWVMLLIVTPAFVVASWARRRR